MHKILVLLSSVLLITNTCALGAMTPFEKVAEGLGSVNEYHSFSMKSEKERDANALLMSKKVRRSSDQVWWVKHHFTFGNEKVKLSFPTIPSVSARNGVTSLVSHSNGVSYTLMGYNPGRKGVDAQEFFNRLVVELNKYPFVLEEHEVEYLDVGGLSAFNAKQVNVETGKKVRSKYIVTPSNSYLLEVVYKNHHDCNCERFFESLILE